MARSRARSGYANGRPAPHRGGHEHFSTPAHEHGAEEEVFVVLDGGGELELWQRGERQDERHPLAAGDVLARPAGSGVAHALRAGAEGMTYLAYGTREPNDTCFYPESGRVSLRGLGISLRSPDIDFL